jgi:hypothetical protein
MGGRSKHCSESVERASPPCLELLFETHVPLTEPIDLGAHVTGQRLLLPIHGGRIEGARIRGRYLPGSSISELVHPNGIMEIEGNLAIELDDGARILLRSSGLLSISPESALELAQGRYFDPKILYMRAFARLEAAEDGPYAWLNRVLCVVKSRRTVESVESTVWQLL